MARLFGDRRSAVAGVSTAAVLAAMEAADVLKGGAAGDDVRDQGTVTLFGAGMAVAVATGAASLLRRGSRPLPRSRPGYWAGLALAWGGIAVNRWARSTLGSQYRPVVTVLEGQEVVDRGPYRLVRHPMYLGGALICGGVGLALGTRASLLAWALPPLTLVQRIRVEERVLREHLGERYEAFAASRSRLIPGLW